MWRSLNPPESLFPFQLPFLSPWCFFFLWFSVMFFFMVEFKYGVMKVLVIEFLVLSFFGWRWWRARIQSFEVCYVFLLWTFWFSVMNFLQADEDWWRVSTRLNGPICYYGGRESFMVNRWRKMKKVRSKCLLQFFCSQFFSLWNSVNCFFSFFWLRIESVLFCMQTFCKVQSVFYCWTGFLFKW